MSHVFDDAYPQESTDADHGRDLDYAVRFKTRRRTTRSSRPSYARRGKAPTMQNGIHRRRRKKIRW